MRKVALLILLFPFLWVCLGSAGTGKYTVRVRAASNVIPEPGTRYVLVSGVEGIGPDNAEFKEFSAYVRKVFTDLHYIEVSGDLAEEVIILSYGLRLPVDVDSLVIPASVDGNRTTRFVAEKTGDSSRGDKLVRPLSSSRLSGAYQSVRNVYRRYLLLVGVNAQLYEPQAKVVPLWKVMAVSTGYSTDLRRIFPIMLVACKPFIGTTTAKEVTVRLREDDEQVRQLREGVVR
jgi:hypothetical protein